MTRFGSSQDPETTQVCTDSEDTHLNCSNLILIRWYYTRTPRVLISLPLELTRAKRKYYPLFVSSPPLDSRRLLHGPLFESDGVLRVYH